MTQSPAKSPRSRAAKKGKEPTFPKEVEDAKDLICDLCANLYSQGAVSGTGGGISIKATPEYIVMAPSGVQKERMQPDDMFVLDAKGEILHTPAPKPPPAREPKLSECSPLFMAAYELRNAGAVIHSHSIHAFMATILDPNATEFRITCVEMIKGIQGHGFYGNLVVPIIENTARECELTDRLRAAIEAYPQTCAVLVRRHGVYVWGKDWIQAKTQSECYDYLFQCAIEMHKMGIDYTRAPAAPLALKAGENGVNGHANGHAAGSDDAAEPATKKPRTQRANLPTAIVLDIEGTVAPISYVKDKMFPYAAKNVRSHLEGSYESEETQEDIEAIRAQALVDAQGLSIPLADAGKEAVIDAVVKWVEQAIAEDRKIGALKQLQGHIWRTGFKAGHLQAELFRDTPDALVEWRSQGIKTYIYSSGSRLAQQFFFGYSQAGDLRPFLCGFFDTTSGPKTGVNSYKEIALSLGVDSPSELLFATDVLAEAQAAKKAGWRAVLVSRPGNAELPADHGFPVITSMTQLLSAA